jgi:hypothetical protein
MRLGQEPKRKAMEAESNPKSGLLRSEKGGNSDMELLDPKTSRGRELGYLYLRLSTLAAERAADPVGLRNSLERRIDAIVRKATGQSEQPATKPVETAPLTLEKARARTELLMRAL